MNAAKVSAFFSSCQQAIGEYRRRVRSRVMRFYAEVQPLLAKRRAEQRAKDRIEASAFTVFDWIRPDENRLSDIFKDLLDPRGKHGQGTLFLEKLLRTAAIPLMQGLDQAKAGREGATWLIDNPLRRIDIVVDLPDFGIAIENKPWACDQVDQVADYIRQMRRRFGERFLLLYWSGHGGTPSSLKQAERESLERQGKLRVWSYRRELRAWLRASEQACQANRVRWFLSDLLNFLAHTFVEKSGYLVEEV